MISPTAIQYRTHRRPQSPTDAVTDRVLKVKLVLLGKYRSNFGEVDVAPVKNDEVNESQK